MMLIIERKSIAFNAANMMLYSKVINIETFKHTFNNLVSLPNEDLITTLLMISQLLSDILNDHPEQIPTFKEN